MAQTVNVNFKLDSDAKDAFLSKFLQILFTQKAICDTSRTLPEISERAKPILRSV